MLKEKIIIFIPLILMLFNLNGQEYKKSYPKSIYTDVFLTIEKNKFNSEFLKHTTSNTYKPHDVPLKDININTFENLSQTIPLTYNYYVKQYIDLYQYGSNTSKQTFVAEKLHKYYTPTTLKYIKQLSLPPELAYIPLVLSGYDANSINNFNGIGYWHLYLTPALKNDLIVTEFIDERKNFEKATKAALLYIKQLYSFYNNWELTFAAYSCGPATVNVALKRTESNSFWEIYPYLPESSRDFTPALIAKIGLSKLQKLPFIAYHPEIEYSTIEFEKNIQIKAIKKFVKLNSSVTNFLNPTLTQEIFPKCYDIKLKQSTINKITSQLDTIYYYQDSVLLKPKKEPTIIVPKNGEPYIYTVKSGDVLGTIADRHNVKVSDLQYWNNLRGTTIYAGQKITIYGKHKSTKPDIKTTKSSQIKQVNKTTPKSNKGYVTYTVKSGDNLWLIAKKYPGISAENIMKLNNIDDNLKIGQVLKIKKK